MNKKIIVSSLMSVVALATIGSTYAFNRQGQTRLQLDDVARTAIHEAIVNGDYAAFQTAISEMPLADNITEDLFQKFVDKGTMRPEMRNGQRGEKRPHLSEEDRVERMADREERRAQMDEIMENKDYSAWLEISPDFMKEKVDSEAKFLRLVEMHEHMQAVREIREELGINEGGKMNNEGGRLNHSGRMGR